MSSSNSPCAACKCLRRKCTYECPFAPYFPPDNPQKFTNVHKVFGASNVAKILNELNASQREDAVNSLAYEAECRLRDPVYGCVGLISILQHRLKQVQADLENAKKELATYIGPAAMVPVLNHPGLLQQQQQPPQGYQMMMPYNTAGLQQGAATHLMLQPQQQFLEAQQLAALTAASEQQMLRTYDQQQMELVRFDDGAGTVVGATGFNPMPGSMDMQPQQQQQQQPSLALGTGYDQTLANEVLLQQHQQQQLAIQQVQPLQQLTRAKSEEDRSIGP